MKTLLLAQLYISEATVDNSLRVQISIVSQDVAEVLGKAAAARGNPARLRHLGLVERIP
jgi:hypothetical protein